MSDFSVGDEIEWVIGKNHYKAVITSINPGRSFTADIYNPDPIKGYRYYYSSFGGTCQWKLMKKSTPFERLLIKVNEMYERQPYVKGLSHAKT